MKQGSTSLGLKSDSHVVSILLDHNWPSQQLLWLHRHQIIVNQEIFFRYSSDLKKAPMISPSIKRRSSRLILTWVFASLAWQPTLDSLPGSCATPASTTPTSTVQSTPVSASSPSLARRHRPRPATHLSVPSALASSSVPSIKLALICSKLAHQATTLSTFPSPLVINASLQRPIWRKITKHSMAWTAMPSSLTESKLWELVLLKLSLLSTTYRSVFWAVDKTSALWPRINFVQFSLKPTAVTNRCRSTDHSLLWPKPFIKARN